VHARVAATQTCFCVRISCCWTCIFMLPSSINTEHRLNVCHHQEAFQPDGFWQSILGRRAPQNQPKQQHDEDMHFLQVFINSTPKMPCVHLQSHNMLVRSRRMKCHSGRGFHDNLSFRRVVRVCINGCFDLPATHTRQHMFRH